MNLAVEWQLQSEPVKSGSPTDSERGRIVNGSVKVFKQIYSGPQFDARTFNLGSHWIKPTAPAPGLAIVHYHARSYNEMIRLATQTIISHKYINATDNSSEIIGKLTPLDRRPECGNLSCHKVWAVLDDLKEPDKMRSAYYLQHGKQPAILRDFRNYLREIFALYPSLLAPAGTHRGEGVVLNRVGPQAKSSGRDVIADHYYQEL